MGSIPPDQLFFSTVCLRNQLGYEEVLDTYKRLGIENVELGYIGHLNRPLTEILADFDFDLLCHNYFWPAEPRFINLASLDDEIRDWSIDYIEKSVDFCSSNGIDLFTFHGGFRVDPSADLEFVGEPAPYTDAFERFISGLDYLADYAAGRGVSLGVENNVVEPGHLDEGENERLMFCRSAEFEQLFDRLSADNVGVLLDVGHLRVAARTLGFDPSEFERLSNDIAAVHLHENDARSDSHQPVDPSGWATDFLFETLPGYEVPIVIESHFQTARELDATRRRLLE